MAVKIRFTRIGKKHAPVYRIVAIDSRKKRDGKFLENLGTYNPMTKEIIQFHMDRINYWISVGAIVTDSVDRLIKIKQKQTGSPKAVGKKTVEPKVREAVEKKPKPVKKAKAKTEEKLETEKSVEKVESKKKTIKKTTTAKAKETSKK